ncbi:MAG: IS256 family transposase, partial [Actinobacteria bacterium]|nr:IS256 family transposase [Actinomycetota bacterium]
IRILTTAVGDLTLLVPQDREGTFQTSLFERYQRSDKALMLALMEMYIKGVSTRKVAEITEKLCGKSFSSQQVSKLTRELDSTIREWSERPLTCSYPYIIVDARYEKVRLGGRIVSRGVLIVLGINDQGKREILSVEIANTENTTTWSDLFRRLKKRGLAGVLLVTSDDHEGIKAAVARHFQGASWQRCQFHFLRNILPLAAKKERKLLHSDLRTIFDSPNGDTAWRRINDVLSNWRDLNSKVAQKIEEEIEETTTVLEFPEPHRKRIRTTNALERLNQEIKRRTNVARIFPNDASALRLITSIAIEHSDEWETGRQYVDISLLDGWQFRELPGIPAGSDAGQESNLMRLPGKKKKSL